MTWLRLCAVSFAYRDDHDVLIDVSLPFDAGWTALTGPNGSGKTTLLALLAGEIQPDEGTVERSADLVLAFCHQSVEHLEPEIAAFAERTDGASRRLREHLRLDPLALDRWPTMSPGERKRWQIGTALDARPDVLLLDEPTNHLDADGRRLLQHALASYRGIGVVVSHDRRFLEALATATVRLEGGRAQRWAAGLVESRAALEAKRAERRRARDAVKGEVERLAVRVADKRRARARAEANISARSRIKGPKDSDARGILARGRVEMAEASLSRDVRVARGKLERTTAKLDGLDVDKTLGRDLFVDYEPAPVARIATLDTPGLRRGGKSITRRTCLTVERTSRIRLAGDNGAGKSTLLHALLGGAHIPASRAFVLPQEIDESGAEALQGELRTLDPRARGSVLGIVAALGVPPAALLSTERPSPGEARKLAIALALARRVWALFLDEPENHLDLPSIERLEAALQSYPGALVLVTHDDALADALTNETWTLPML